MNFRIASALLFMVLGLGVLGGSWTTYTREAQMRPVRTETAGDDQVRLSVKELQSLFPDYQVKENRFATIAEKNLFSQNRQAWAPPKPKPKPEPQPEPGPEPEKEEKPPPPPPDPNRDDVVLYGTYITEKTRKAILKFKSFQTKPQTRRVNVGETVRDVSEQAQTGQSVRKNSEKKRPIFYHITSIEQREVTLEDDKGIVFTVGLFEHERTEQRAAATPQKQIVVSKKPQPAGQASSRVIGSSAQKAPADQPRSSSSQRTLKTVQDKARILKMSQEEKDRLVQEGKLRKIDTPFGAIYEPKD